MVFFYLNEHSKISLSHYKKLCVFAEINIKKRKCVEIQNRSKQINELKGLNNDLAELLGILAGDGHISTINYEVSVSGNLKEGKEYMTKHVKRLFERLFNCHVRIYEYKPNNNIKCIVNSKKLVEYLSQTFNLPVGKKKNKLHIPQQILENKNYLKHYIRGLFDTDGSVYQRRKNEVVVSIIARDKQFLEEVKTGLMSLMYKASISGKNLYIYNQLHTIRFFNEIKPNYQNHIKRFDIFLKKSS